MKDRLWTKSDKLRVLIHTTDTQLFAECKNIINNVSCNNPFKLKLYSLLTPPFSKEYRPLPGPVSPFLRIADIGRAVGVPVIDVRPEALYVDALAVEYGNPVDYVNSPYDICKKITQIQSKDSDIKRRAHIDQTAVLFDTSNDDIFAPVRQLWGEIALCEGMPLNYVRRGRFDTIFIPEGFKDTLACNLRWKDIGHIAGKYNATTPLYRILHDIYFYLAMRFQPF